jgi:dihydrofolate reductase
MRNIVYYVAVSLDGFISGPADDVSLFLQEGTGVEKYQRDLEDFDTVIMGRKTYEFGYAYGMEPGQLPYPNMEHYIFSNTLNFKQQHEKVHVLPVEVSHIKDLKRQDGSDIYLCGGSIFAGWLLGEGLIDILKIKLNPILIGHGEPLFRNAETQARLTFKSVESFDKGLQILTYEF